jgi:hypothetical protein
MQPIAVSDFAAVKLVKGSLLQDYYSTHKFIFSKKDGTEIAKVELCNHQEYGPEFVLDDSEEIIGIFGSKNTLDFID